MTVDLRRLWAEAKADAVADAVAEGRLRIEPGYWLVRWTLRAPEVPAMIALCDHEPGDQTNKLDRAPYFIGAIAGEDCDPVDIYRCKTRRPIDEAEYRFRLAERAWAQEWAPEDVAALHPKRPADLTKLKPIF